MKIQFSAQIKSFKIGGFRQENQNTMGKKKMVDLSAVFWFVLISSCSVSAQKCSKRSDVFTPNSPYDLNRQAVLSFLPSNVTANDGFYKTSSGEDPDIAYGLGMCIPGTESQACSDCIKALSGMLLQNCRNEVEATDWRYNGSLCLVRYSNRLFSGSLDEEIIGSYNTGEVQVNVTEFEEKWEALMLSVIRKASFLSNSEKYAAGTQMVTVSTNIYGFVQCSKDLSSENCSKCLRQNLNDRACCRGTQGGSTARMSCFMRWDINPFWGLLFEDMNDQTKKGTKNGSML